MNTVERVIAYLRKNPNETICDDCLRGALAASASLTRMLDVLNTDYVRRENAKCEACGATKMTTTGLTEGPTK